MTLLAGLGLESLLVELGVDRIGARLPGMKLAPELAEANVVLAPAERTRAMSGGESRRLVEEEELREPARLKQMSRDASRGTRACRRSSACRCIADGFDRTRSCRQPRLP